MRVLKIHIVILLVGAAMMIINACGSSSSDAPAPTPTETTSVTGSVYASSVSGAAVVVKDASGNTIAGPVTSGSDGTYSIDIPTSALASDLSIVSVNGTFTDEATGLTTTAGMLAAYVSGGTLTTGPLSLDPSSTIVYSLVTNYGKSVADANTAFNAAFGFTPDTSITPMNDDTSETTQRLAALRAGAFSQLTSDLGLAPARQFDLLEAISQDLADGTLNGKNGSTTVSIGTSTAMPEDIENRFESALVSLLSNTTANLTGLTAADIGALPFSKVALTDTYRVEYVPGMMTAAQGKTIFTLNITKRSDGSAATGLTISLMPMMHMASDEHATPADAVIDNGDGTYSCKIYYLMASMMNGVSQGYWECKIMIGMSGETATFYPSVGMAMGSDTIRATLKGQNDDVISSMTGTEKRTYYLFNDGLVSGMTYTFNLFIAAKESMMNYPAVSINTNLHDENAVEWTVNSMIVTAATDSSFTSPVSAVDDGNGHWSVSGLSGLTSGSTGTIYIKMNINTMDKTTDGKTPSGSNGYATFAVTPGSGM
jgi:hypothetical protein